MTTDSGARAQLARTIPRRPRVSAWLGMLLALGFAVVVTTSICAERWLGAFGVGRIVAGERASLTVRVPPLAGYDSEALHLGAGGIVVARGEVVGAERAGVIRAVADSAPHGIAFVLTIGILAFAFAALFTVHARRSTRGRLLRIQLVNLILIAVVAVVVKAALLVSPISVLAIPFAVLAMLPTLVVDRAVGLATGVLAALVGSLLVPFDVGVAIVLLVQVATVGLVIAERPKHRARSALAAGAVATVLTAITYPLIHYLTTGHLPTAELADPLRSAWVAAAAGPAIATVIVFPLLPLYERAVGEITPGRLLALEDLSNPLLRQIADKAPGSWQHSLMLANMGELAANAIGANGRLVRVGAYYHNLGKSLHPSYFPENLGPGAQNPHDNLPPEVSADAVFQHLTDGLVAAKRAGLHPRVIDFMHMQHGDGVLEGLWQKARDLGNPRGSSLDAFRYPGVPPQTRETAILAISDAVENASRALKKPDVAAFDAMVQRVVYGKLHLGQLDESGLSMADLRRVSDSLLDTITAANRGRLVAGAASPAIETANTAVLAPGTPADAALAETAQQRTQSQPKPVSPVVDTIVAVARTRSARRALGEPMVAVPVADVPTDDLAVPRTRSNRLMIDVSSGVPVRGSDPSLPDPNAAAVVRGQVEAAAARPANTTPVPTGTSGATITGIAPAPARSQPTSSPAPITVHVKRASTVVPPPDTRRRPPTLAPTLAERAAQLGDDPANSGRITSQRPATVPPPKAPPNPAERASSLAERIDKLMPVDTDSFEASEPPPEFETTTPVFVPNPAELRALNGHADPTRKLSVEEVEAQHAADRAAAEAAEAERDPELLLVKPRRPMHVPTAEVDPDDIEAALELAPPARRSQRIPIKKPPV